MVLSFKFNFKKTYLVVYFKYPRLYPSPSVFFAKIVSPSGSIDLGYLARAGAQNYYRYGGGERAGVK